MQQSKYVQAFQEVAKRADLYQLVGDCVLIEQIADEEFRTKSGLIIASDERKQNNGIHADKPTFVRILLVGEGSPDDDGNIEPWDVSPGDICLVGSSSIKKFSVFGKLVTYGETTLGLIRATDIQLRFKGQEGFDGFFAAVNSAAEAQMATRQS